MATYAWIRIINLMFTFSILINLGGGPVNMAIGIPFTNHTLNTNANKTVESDLLGTPRPFYKYQPYLILNGSNYVDIPNNDTLQLTNFSIAAWFRTTIDVPFRSNAYIVNKGGFGLDKNGTNMNYGIWMTSSETIRAGFEDLSGADYSVESPSSPNLYNHFQWHFVVTTYDGSTLRIYIDGIQIGTKFVGALPDNTSTQPVRIGANSFKLNGFFTGNVDEIRIWNRPLTDSEILVAYNRGVYNTEGMLLYRPF